MKIFKLDSHRRYIETIPALYAFVWGLWILFPWKSFETSLVYSEMARLAPEWLWGTFYAALGFFQLLVYALDKPKLRIIGMVISMFAFINLTIFAAFGNYQSTASPSFFVMAIAAWLSFNRILIEVRGKE
jgi:hypothetical protein